jgi:hypothetical protein
MPGAGPKPPVHNAVMLHEFLKQPRKPKNKEVIGELVKQLTPNPFPLAARGFLIKCVAMEKLVLRLLKVFLLLKEF